MCLFVCRLSLKRKRVYRELRTLLNKNIFLSVVPIREASHIRTHGCKRLALFYDASVYRLCRLSFTTFKCLGSCGLEVHLVGINDFCFFFQVESFLMAFKHGLRSSVGKVLFVVGKKLRVGVAHESVCTARVAHAFVANRQFNVYLLVDLYTYKDLRPFQ